ncbi:mucin-binding protein [Limosilactobacillus reuteri]|uniref:mucin-binding protein n=1 Tax=Limosilactobacillus reuteri TaxID=1598 RepID=UPI00226D1C24|nr:YSIRK-type signal peptide-containing protein [Limosilactobacillus reuteri]
MLSRNNHQEQIKKYEPKKQRFTIKKLSVGVASVLLGISFANGVSADTTDTNADANANNGDGSEQTDHNLVLNSANNQTLKEATVANQASGATATSQNPAGDVQTPAANEYEAAVSAAMAKEAQSSKVASTTTVAASSASDVAVSSASATTQANSTVASQQATTASATSENSVVTTQTFDTQAFNTTSINAAKLARLYGASFIAQPSDSGPTDLASYNPNFNISNGKDYESYFGQYVPSNQIGFTQWRDKTNGKILTAATDKDNPGENIYFYVGNKLATTIGKDVYSKPWGGPLTITQTNGNVYKGGTYTYSRAINTQIPGTSYRYTRINLYDRNGKSPVAVPSTGAFTSGGSNLTVVYGSGNPINESPIAQQNWNSAGGMIPGKAQQTIWYVNADTGEVMAHKSSEKLIPGQTYDVTDGGPAKVLYNNKVYSKIERSADGYDESKLSQSVLDTVLTTNAGVKITVGDVLNTPLKGTIGDSRKGNVAIGTTDYGPSRLYISQQIDDGGTVTLNTYDVQPSDVVPGAIDAKLVQAGNITTQSLPSVYTAGTGDPKLDAAAATAQGDKSAFFNGRRPGNQDVVFLYRAVSNPQNANITFVNDDTGASLNPQQDASGDAGSQISFNNAASTVANLINQGYVYNGTTGTGVTNGSASGSFTSVSFPVYDNDDNTNQAFVVHFKNPAQTTTYHQGVEESKTIQRTINYYDKVTGARIPSSLIAQNPITDSVTFTRTQVLDQNGKVVGYGTVGSDGKSFRTQDWHTTDGTTQFDPKRSSDLSAYNYTAPEFQDGTSANVVAAHKVTPDTQNLEYNVYYGHQTQQVTTNQDVTRRFHYIFTDGTTPESHLTPQADQKVTFTGTATKDLVTGKTGDTVWTPATGTLAQVAGQQVAGYHITGNVNANADGSANAVTVNPDSGDIDVTIVYTPDAKTPDTPQKAKVTIYDKTENNKQLSAFENNNGTKGSAISFDGEPQTLQAYLNSGYVFDSATDANGNSIGTASNITFGNFDSIDDNVQSFNIYLVHGTDTKTEKATTNAHVHYVVAGNEANKPAAPADSPVQTINWTRTNTTDKVTGATTEGTWTPDKNGFTSVTSPTLTNYTPDQAVANFTTPQPNRDQVVTVVYNPNPEVAQKADLVVYDKTDNNKELNNFNNSGKTGTQISFSGSANYVADLIAKGYKIDSFVNDQNQTSNPTSYDQINFSNFDNNSASDQHFKLYLVHDTDKVTDKKTTTSTVHYVVSDGKTNPPSDSTQTITWTRPGTKDKVTGVTTPTGNWTTPDNYTDVPTPNLNGYTPDKTNVPAPTPDPNQNPTTVVTYNPKTPDAPTYTGTTETKTVTRTINYYDRVTGEKIPTNLIAGNPTTQNVTLSRTHVVSSTGQDMGYGTVSADGKTFTKAATADGWNTGDWTQVTSPDLSNAGYTTPDLAQADQVTVDANTKDAVVNVYYGHQTEVITPKNPHNPGGNINPNDPRNTPSVYPDGLTKEALTTEVTRHINYVGVNEDGTTTPVNGAPDGKSTYTQTVSFERDAVIDKVTGQILGYSTDGTTNVTTTDKDRAWTPTTQNMDSVASKTPSEVGYDKVDIPTVGGVTVYPGQRVNDVTVTYTKNKTPEVTQKATLEIIDNNDANSPKQLASFSNEGKSEDQINFANSNEILQSYLSQGYKVQKTAGNLSGDAQSGYTYPTYGNTAQDFKIYLIHDTEDKTENATATAQVHYVVADNGVQAPKDSELQTITYTRTNKVDKVTGAVVNEGEWKTDKNAFTDVTSPDLSKDGYTPSLENVQFNAPERNVNQRVTVVYNRSAQAADLQIIDDNDPQNQRVLATYSAGGESGKQISFDGSNTQLQSYLNQGYTFEKSEGQGMSGDAQNGFTYPSFDNDSQSNQSFKIYLKHATGNKNETATTTAHVHYIMADGTKAPDDSATQTITWTQTNTVDQVTGAIVNEGKWKADKNAFTDVDSPEVTGYTPETKTVKFATPERGINQVVNVVYTKNAPTSDQQNALVVYQDVNDPAHPVDLGQSDQLTGQGGDAINYSTADKIAEYEKQGYVLVSNGFDANGTKPSFDNVKGNTQTFYVTFKHGIQPVTPTTPGTPGDKINPNDPNPESPKYPAGTTKENLTEEVTRTVTYEGAGDQTPSPVTDTLYFQGTGYLDKVTGKWTDANGNELADQAKGITWTIVDGTKDSGSFDLVPTKHIDGYTSQVVTDGADDGNGNVKNYTGINHSSQDINVVVKYSPVVAEKGNLIVKFHDDTENKDLTGVGTDTGTQDVGTQVTYNPSTDLTNLENKGYVYVSTDGNIPSSIVKGTTTVTIHVKHGTVPVTPDNPGTPDKPINPNDPDGPKYPSGTDKASIDKTITRTVHYEGADQYTPNDVQQPVHFTAKGVLDKVTGEWTKPLDWSADQTFNGVTTPKIPGYHVVSVDRDTTDNQNVDSAKISHTGADYTVTVKYAKDAAPTPDTTTGKVTYIDDTTGSTLKTDSLNGNVDANIDYTTQDKINRYINMGYKLVSNNFTDGKEVFNKDASKNSFEVHLVHDTVPVTPENPGTPDQPINPNDPRPQNEQPKYPNGTSETDLTKDITRTVHYAGAGEYTPNDVQQPVHFTAKGVLDKVTGEWTKPLTWSADQAFNGVTTPKIPGYHVVSVDRDANGNDVASTTIAHTGSDYTVTVTYAPDEKPQAENAKLHIIDINDGNKEIGTFSDSGADNATINFNGASTTVDSLIKAGYKVNSIKHTEKSGVVTDGGEGADYGTISSQWKFDDQPGFDQDFYVYLEHDYAPINPENAYGRTDLTQTVTETVHYVDEATNKPVATDYTNTLTFKGQGRVDKVTGKMLKIKSIENGQITYDYNVDNEIDISSAKLSDFAWSNPTTLAKVVSPTIAGYTIDAAKTTPSELVDGNDIKEIQNVAYDHGNVEATVYYKANPVENHKAGLIIYANGKQVGTASVTGAKDTAIDFGSASDIVAAYISNGYKFDHAQDVTNNREMAGKSYSELNFGNFATANNSDQRFAIYLTKDETPAKTQQNAQLIIRDATSGQEQDLGSYTQPGLEGDAISFGSAQEFVQNLLNKGYVWDGASYNGTNLDATNYAGINFGNYDNADDKDGISQKWVINLVHGVTPVNPDHPDDKDGYTKEYLDRTITRDVTYVDEQGNAMPGLTPEHQEAKFQGSGYLDNVTGKWVNVENGKITGLADGLTWTPDTDATFDAIAAKTADGYHVISVSGNGISGFTVDANGAVTAQTVNHNTASSTIKVVYAKTPEVPVAANGSIVYIDDTTGNRLENATFGGSVGQKINYTTADRIANYEGRGYKLVSNNFKDGNESFTNGENKFEVHLTHDTTTKDVTKTVTRDVTYVYEDGSQADTPVNQNFTFNGKTVTDRVTGAEKTSWDTDGHNFDATKSIDTTNYQVIGISKTNTTANVDRTNGVVASETITPTSQNSSVVITLAKKVTPPTPVKQGTIEVIYHDTTDNVDIPGYGQPQTKEDQGTAFSYNPNAKDLPALENKGYVLDGELPTIPTEYTDGNQRVVINVKHGTRPVTPENPADPDKPVDPTKPNTPTPSNPNLAKTDLEKTITRTVKYQYADGTSAHADAVQTVNFKGQGTIDLVTGNLITVDKDGNILNQRGKITWNHDSQDFANVVAINHDGYYVSNVSENGTTAKVDGTAVAGETVTPTSQNSTIVITLTKNPEVPVAANGSITYIDDTTGNVLASATFGGNVGQKINYTTADKIANYVSQGYNLVSNNFNDGNETFAKDGNVFEVHLVHATTPITPENPGKPGQEVPNPNDPEHPHKIPANFVPQTLTNTVTRDVTYVYEDGSQAEAPVHQTFTFTGNGVVDLVTGQLVTVENGKITGAGHITWNAENHNFDATKSIDTTNYNIVRVSENNTTANVDMNNGVVAGETITPASQNSTVVITLAKKPVTPTPVQKGTVIVNYVDKTTGKTLETATSTGNEGSNVNYSTKDTITKYTNQGYKLEHDGYPTGTVTYTNGTVTYEVDLVHETVPVNPDQPGPKTPNTPINPDNPDGPKYPDGTQPEQLTKTITRTINYVGDGLNIPSVEKSLTFVANGVLDKVTGQWVTVDKDGKITGNANGMTWTVKDGNADEGSFDEVAGPQTEGYHITNIAASNEDLGDINSSTGTVAGKTINHTNGNIVITINYAKNPVTPTPTPADQTVVGKQIVHYVDGDNNNAKLLDDNTNDTFVFTKSGKTGTWNADSHKYANANAPVIDGYVAEQKTYEGQTATPGDADKEITIVYHKIGKIIPVDPSGNPIPDAPTPSYHNDPTDPTKVTPNEPTPTVPGWTTNVPNVTPDTPTGDTKVPYTKPTPTQDKGSITITVHDVTDNTDLPEYGKTSGSQNVGTEFSYDKTGTFTSLTNKGYKIVNPDVTIPTGITKGDQNIVIYVEHTTTPITPENPGKPGQPINPNDPTGPQYPAGSDQVTKDVTRTITYVDNNGNKLHDSVEQTAHFTGTGVIDNVTGKWVTPITWNGNGDLSGQNTPVIDGYHVTSVSRDGDGNNVAKVTVNHGDSDYTVVVTYTPNGKIVPVDPSGKPIPDAPTPQYPTDPSDPAKVTPDEPVPSIPGFTPEVPTVTPNNPGEDTPVVYTPDTPVTPVTVQGKVTYVDDTTGQTISTDDFSGKIGDKITYTTADKISELEGQGYELVSNNFKDGNETFTNGENSFVVHLKHAETIVTPENPHDSGEEGYATQKTTTFTVHYVGAGDKTPADRVETIQWHREVIVDSVTGKVISTTPWTTDGRYTGANTPVVDGFHADKAVVNAPQADPDKDVVETVTYAPNGHIIPVDKNGTPIPGADQPVYPTDPTDPTKVVPNEPVPTVPGYTPERETVTPVDPGTDTPVVYDRRNTPVTPETPTTTPTTPGDDTPSNETPVTPETPVDNGGEEGNDEVTPTSQVPESPANNGSVNPAVPQPTAAKQTNAQQPVATTKAEAKKLPQTGNADANSAEILGLAALGLTGLVGLGKKRRKED